MSNDNMIHRPLHGAPGIYTQVLFPGALLYVLFIFYAAHLYPEKLIRFKKCLWKIKINFLPHIHQIFFKRLDPDPQDP